MVLEMADKIVVTVAHQRVAVRITFPEDVLKEVPLRPGLSVVATVHTRDPDAPKPTLLGALGLEAFATRSVKP